MSSFAPAAYAAPSCGHPVTEARRLDEADPLAFFAQEFHHPENARGEKLIYLAGHSLGLQPKRAAHFVQQELTDWRRMGVLGHHHATRPWIGYHEGLLAPLASLAGAQVSEVIAMNSLTINLHLMMVSFFKPQGERRRILIEQAAFPSDRYAVVSQLQFHGLSATTDLIEVAPREAERLVRTEDLIEAIERQGPRLALVLLPGVQYLTGQLLDMPALIAAAHRAGARVGLDLAHAIGNTPLKLHDWKPDFAVWCSYKYLNAGPGAVGGCFVHARHHDAHLPRFAGWWGHDATARFLFEPDFKPMAGAQGWQVSNPPILSSAPLLASLELFERAGIAALRQKSLKLTGTLRHLIEARLKEAVEIITPCAPESSGCQLSLKLKLGAAEARRCQQRLESAGVIADWREPDIMRLAPVPFYNSYADVFATVDQLQAALQA